MEFSGPILELMKLISPDGQSFDAEKFQEAAANLRDLDAKMSAQLDAPTRSPEEQIANSAAAYGAFEPYRDAANQRNVNTYGSMQDIRNDAFGSQLGDVTKSQLSLLKPAYDSVSEGRQMHSADYGKTLEYNATQRNLDREMRRDLMNKRNVMGLIQTGVGGGALLLKLLRDN